MIPAKRDRCAATSTNGNEQDPDDGHCERDAGEEQQDGKETELAEHAEEEGASEILFEDARGPLRGCCASRTSTDESDGTTSTAAHPPVMASMRGRATSARPRSQPPRGASTRRCHDSRDCHARRPPSRVTLTAIRARRVRRPRPTRTAERSRRPRACARRRATTPRISRGRRRSTTSGPRTVSPSRDRRHSPRDITPVESGALSSVRHEARTDGGDGHCSRRAPRRRR